MSFVKKAHKIRLNPTPEQEQYFWKAAGVARYSFNWGLAEYNRRLDHNREYPQDKIKVNGRLLKKAYNLVKPDFVNEVNSYAYQGAFDDLQSAFRNFWHKHKNGLLPEADKPRKDGRPNGWPCFKSRYRTTPAFYLANQCLKFDSHWVQFDKKRVGQVNMAEPLRFDGKVLGGRISYRSNHWWLSVQVEVEQDSLVHNGDAVGVDLGIKYLAVTSDGVLYENPKPLVKALRKLRRLQRKADRQLRASNPDNYNGNGTVKKGPKTWHESNNLKKTRRQIERLHYRVTCLRQETSHKMTTDLARSYAVIGLEDLNLRGMMKNRRLAKSIGDAALFEKRRQLTYKADWNGGTVVLIDRWFPSSKQCNQCKEINPFLTLSQRQWECACGAINHRDGNAAKNILEETLRILNETRRTTQAESINDPTLIQMSI